MSARRPIALFLFAARAIVGAVFIFASIGKIQDPDGFSQAILGYRIISSPLFVTLVATLLPWTELVAGFCLILDIYRRGSACLILALLIIFIFAIVQGMTRNLDISCGCFTLDPAASKIGIPRLLEDIGLAILASITLTHPASQSAPG
jgi:uncharacterized membrane protein YphA (DoxX/SURF4 family)